MFSPSLSIAVLLKVKVWARYLSQDNESVSVGVKINCLVMAELTKLLSVFNNLQRARKIIGPGNTDSVGQVQILSFHHLVGTNLEVLSQKGHQVRNSPSDTLSSKYRPLPCPILLPGFGHSSTPSQSFFLYFVQSLHLLY